MAVSNELNRVKYISEDFQTYREEADTFFQTHYPEDFNNLIATDLGNALMDQLAFAMQAVAFMMNRRSSELFLATARLNKSITKLARMLGYPIQPAAPATTDLTITLTGGPYAFPVPIPVGFQFRATGNIIYEYIGAVNYVIPAGMTTATIPVKEGQTRTATFISDGSENQQFSIFGIPDSEYMYSDDITLTVDGAAWDRLSLLKFESTDTYEILFTDSPPKLRFGDGIAGNIPEENSQILISFRYGRGLQGAVGQNQILNAVAPLVVNGSVIPMSFTNTVANVGQDPEDIRHVRVFASTFFRTQNAAVVKQDYDSIAALETGVALADAQISRGIDDDITIQANLACISGGIDLVGQAVSGIQQTSVTGVQFLGVSGIGGLFVGGTSGLAVSGTSFLGCDVSGNVTGTQFLGVQGVGSLFVGGTSDLGVSGISLLGVSNQDQIASDAASGFALIEDCVSGLASYLSQAFSDTSKANNVQVVVLSVDSNNRYISPSITTLQNVQSKLRSLADAVVTVFAVDGSSKIVEADIVVEIGVNQSAVKDDVEQNSLNALTYSVAQPYGLLIRRMAGVSLYRSDIVEAVDDANDEADIRFINAKITGPSSLIDADGNLIIDKQQIIQDGNVSVKVTKRFLADGSSVDA